LDLGRQGLLALLQCGGLAGQGLFAVAQGTLGRFGLLAQFAFDGVAVLLEDGFVEGEGLMAMGAGDEGVGGGHGRVWFSGFGWRW